MVEIMLKFGPYDKKTVPALNSKSPQVFLGKSAQLLAADIKIDRRLLDGECVLLAERDSLGFRGFTRNRQLSDRYISVVLLSVQHIFTSEIVEMVMGSPVPKREKSADLPKKRAKKLGPPRIVPQRALSRYHMKF